MATFNGHKNWNHWNVSIWLDNDEGLYGLCKDAIRRCRTKDRAAAYVLAYLGDEAETPDGAPFTFTSIRAALRGM